MFENVKEGKYLFCVCDINGTWVELIPGFLTTEVCEADLLVWRLWRGPLEASGLASIRTSFALMFLHLLQFSVVDEPLQGSEII